MCSCDPTTGFTCQRCRDDDEQQARNERGDNDRDDYRDLFESDFRSAQVWSAER